MAEALTRGTRIAAALPALAVLALGLTIAAGWIVGRKDWLLMLPGTQPMVIASALGFVLAGVTLLAALGVSPRWQRLRRAGGLALVVLGLVVLAQHAVDLPPGPDFAGLHAATMPGLAGSGRMSPPSALAFLLAGILAVTFDVPGDRLRALVVQVLAGTLLAVGLVSLIAYDIEPDALFPGYRMGWMPVASAGGFIGIGIALLALIARSPWYRDIYRARDDERILILTLGILVLVSLAISAAGLSMIQRNLERSLRASLAQAVTDRTAILESVFQNRVKRAGIIATRPSLVEHLSRWRMARDARSAEALRIELESFLPSGFNAVALEDARGELVAVAGSPLGPVPLEAGLTGHEVPTTLRWNQGYFLRTRIPVWQDFAVIGHVTSEQPLEIMDRLQLEVGALGATAEWVLCAAETGRMACFPHRFSPLPRYAPLSGDADALPAEHALQGRNGVENANDYRGNRVIAGFAPVGASGLGVVLKLDAEEYYAPIREQLRLWWRWILALSLVGALLVSSQVRPVARRLMDSERLARERAAELERRERSLRELYASLGDGIVVMAADGTVEFMNPAAARLFGYGQDELIGRPVATLIPEKYRDANALATQRFLQTGESGVLGHQNLLFPAMRKDGSLVDVEFSLAQMRQEETTRIVAVVRDVSEREKLVRMKSEFIARVSHELRTPLTAIVGSLELLRDEDMGVPPGPARNFLDMAWRNSERLAMLVNDVIDTERIESGALAFRDMEFELAPFLVESVDLNQPYATREKVVLVAEQPMPRAWVRADRDRLMQVMANLLSNAAKFSPEGSEVRVTAQREGDTVRVCVIDRGDGIPEEFQPRIFEKFAQADGSDTREFGGTGLGLAIAKAIIERVGGRIGFDTARGAGTTFWFELPASNPA